MRDIDDIQADLTDERARSADLMIALETIRDYPTPVVTGGVRAIKAIAEDAIERATMPIPFPRMIERRCVAVGEAK